jgi:site-specific DNA-methyltransferase (cytosine-N4-specific)
MLTDIKGVLKPFYETNKGSAFLGDSLNLLKLIPDNSVDLILTSPPFAFHTKAGQKKEFPLQS